MSGEGDKGCCVDEDVGKGMGVCELSCVGREEDCVTMSWDDVGVSS